MSDATTQQIQALIRMGAEQFTGGDVAAFLRLATGETDSALSLDRDKGPTVKELEDIALAGGFLGNFCDFSAWEYEQVESVLDKDGAERAKVTSKKLTSKQAWFMAWFGADERIRQPKTVADVARYLHISRTRLYEWINSDWFNVSGIQRWERRFLVDHIPALYRKVFSNAMDANGAVSNQAARLLFEVREKQLGLIGPGAESLNPNLTQVNVYLPDNGR